MVFLLAMRNLFLQRKRYALLFIAVMTGFLLVTLVSGLVVGALGTVKDKAARYFAGHVSVVGFNSSKGQEIKDPTAIRNLISAEVPGLRTISPRTVYYRQDCSIFFNGETIRQRRLVGLDFEREIDEYRSLAFLEGGVESMLGENGENGILISRTASKLLGAKLGESINIFLTTDTGQFNSSTLYVRGIFDETSLFGYVAYVRKADLNRLLLKPGDFATDIAIFAKNGYSLAAMAAHVRETLSVNHKVFPPLASREALAKAAGAAKGVDESFAVLSLDAYLAQIKDIMDALMIVTYFVLGVFVIIVMVGIVSTYRVLVYERTKEIGTIRALGMQRGDVKRLFLFEAAGLGFFASIAGLCLGVILLSIAEQVNLGALPAAGMFTNAGHLTFVLDPKMAAMNLFVMTLAVMGAAWGPSKSAGEIQPAEALRGDS